MELSKIEINFKDLNKTAQTQTLLINFALIDKTSFGSDPGVYIFKNENELKEEDFQLIKNGFVSIDPDSFIFLGFLQELDQKEKKIVLANQNLLFYHHLVIANGPKQALLGYEFLAGVQTLIDAVKINKKIPSAFASEQSSQSTPKSGRKLSNNKPNSKIKKIASEKPTPPSSNGNLAESTKRLYQIQL